MLELMEYFKMSDNLSRNDQREKVVQALYSCLINEQAKIDYDPRDIFLGVFKLSDFSQGEIFPKEIFVGALKNKDKIISEIEPKLIKWQFSRLNTYAQALLLEAVSEGKYSSMTPKSIVIDSAVNLAKKYLDAKDYRYINAVLDKVL